MASRIYQGGTTGWYLSTNWSPQGVPTAGDILNIASGNATISAADVIAFGTLDNETLQLGGAAAAFSADGASFGNLFTISSQGAGFATLDLSGAVNFAGSIIANSAGGQTSIHIAADATGSSDVTLTGGITIGNGDSVVVNGGTVIDDGSITVSNGVLNLGSNTTLQGTGTILVGANGTVEIDGPVMQGITIEFAANTGTLLLGDPLFFNGAVTGFVKGDAIDLLNAPSYDWLYNSTTSRLTVLGGNISSAPEVAKFVLKSTSPLVPSQIFVGQDGNGGSEIQLADIRTWAGGSSGDWYVSSNWTTSGTSAANSYPLFGDNAIINGGTAIISASDVASFGTLNNGNIQLTGTGAGLQITGDTLGSDLHISTSGSLAAGMLEFDGTTVSSARIQVTGSNTRLGFTIGNAGSVSGDFVNMQFGTILAGAGALLTFNGGRVTNQGQIVVNGLATIAAGATIDGTGVIELNNNASVLTVAGSVAAGQQVAFDAFSDLVIKAGAAFNGTIEDFQQGNTIDLAGVIANYASYDVANSLLTLRQNGAGGSIVASLTVAGNYGPADFSVQSDGKGGTGITTRGAANVPVFYATLPVPAVATTGASVSLISMLTAAFGTAYVASIPSFQLWSESPADLQDFSYWNPSDPLVSYWTLNGTVVAPDNLQPFLASDLAGVQYVSGNAIVTATEVQIPVAFDNLGNPTGYANYSIQNFESPIAQPGLYGGQPTPQDIVNAASAFAAAYTNVPNTEDCWNIAAEVAAAAGAPMARYTASLYPPDNYIAGFWRIAYAAPQDGSAVSNWSTLVQAGDILRIGWANNGGQHSFTVVSPLDVNGDIAVFDNVYYATPGSFEAIGIHAVQYWTDTDPSTITIYRLDPSDRYLINDITIDGALIQGTSFNDLIIPGGADDIMSGAAGNDDFANISSILNGSTITDFHVGDTIDVTDLDSASTTVGYDAVSGLLTLSSFGALTTMQLPTGLAGNFTITNDGGTAGLDGGTLGVLYNQLYATPSAQGSLIELVTCFVAGTHIMTGNGDVPIEHLRIGDRVICADGSSESIVWIGYRALDPRRHPDPAKVLPIRVAAGAFGNALPRRDLLLSPDHAVFAEGVLIPVRYLVNGATITQVSARSMRMVRYYHIELARHSVIAAEGLPVESYLDTGDRGRFSNADAPVVLHPDFASRIREAEGCAPLCIVGPEVAAVRARLARYARTRRAPQTATRRRSSSASFNRSPSPGPSGR
jgi:hypothetical protein